MDQMTISIASTILADNEIMAAERVLRSGMLRQGKECDSFEKEFSAYTGARHTVTCANGSAALQLAYLSFLQPGDEVLVPSMTFIATASMVVACGGRPVFCDIDPRTFLMDLDDAQSKISPRTKAIAPVHLFGNVCDPNRVARLAGEHGLKVVWDAAHAHGSKFGAQDIGCLDDFVCYSLYPSKVMFVGEGGLVLTNDLQAEEMMRLLRSHGQSGKYLHTLLGYNLRMTDVEAAIGREQLKRLDEMLAVRQRNADIYNSAFQGVPGLSPQVITSGAKSTWYQYCVRIEPDAFGCTRDALASFLKGQGIATAVHYPRGLHQQPIFIEKFGAASLPGTELLCEQVLALPVHHALNAQEVERVAAAVLQCRSDAQAKNIRPKS